MQPLNIVLDVDGTLVEEVSGPQVRIPKPRPYLHEFLQYLFRNFQHVSIWSAASEQWVLPLVQDVIQPPEPFYFVWAGKRITLRRRYHPDYGSVVQTVKNLKRVWKSFPDFTRDNTLILDDTPSTYMNNYGNGIGISTYTGNDNDVALLTLIDHLEEWKQEYQKVGSVRHIGKLTVTSQMF